MPKQVYDSDGTTSFQFTFIDKSSPRKKDHKEWHVFFAQGFISIANVSNDTRIKVNFPEEDHWFYGTYDSEWKCGGVDTSSYIKTNDFTLTAGIRRYPEAEDSDCDEGCNEGWLELDTKVNNIIMIIPFMLASNLMKFMSGSTDLKGICGVHKS